MSHKHQHSCTCPHENLHYCLFCKVVQCLDCNQEWGSKYTYPSYTTTIPYYGGTTYQTAQMSTAAPQDITPTITCSHGGK